MTLQIAGHARPLVNKKIPLPNFKNIAQAVDWLQDHPMFLGPDGIQRFSTCFDWECVMVNPKTNKIDDDKHKNTVVHFWVECGPLVLNVTPVFDEPGFSAEVKSWSGSHDRRLDTGGRTFELAMWSLVTLVHKFYGGYEEEKVHKFIKNRNSINRKNNE